MGDNVWEKASGKKQWSLITVICSFIKCNLTKDSDVNIKGIDDYKMTEPEERVLPANFYWGRRRR